MRQPADAEQLLERLVAFPTVAGQPNRPLIEFAHDWLERHGARVSVAPSDWRADGYNLHAVFGPEKDGGILVAAHTDVVAVEGQRWTSDPFCLRPTSRRLYGRGTADMKGFIAATLAAIGNASLRELTEPLQLALSCDEELGCKGVGSLLDELAAASGRPSLCVVGEPTRMVVADRHKGKMSIRVEVRGRAAHSSIPARGVNAVTFAARLITMLDELFDQLDRGPADNAFTARHATVSVGPVHGGVSLNIVPDHCMFEVEFRYLPGDDPRRVLRAIRQHARTVAASMQRLAPETGIELAEIASYPPLSPCPEAVAAMASLGVDGAPIAVDFGTEAGYYNQRLRTPCVVCGPGDMAVAHQADEYIERGQLRAAERLVTRVIAHLTEGSEQP